MKNTIPVCNISSISLRSFFSNFSHVTIVRTVGEGDGKVTLYRSSDGLEGIETNGDSITSIDGDDFEDSKAALGVAE